MRTASRTDANHAEIVAALRSAGATVQSLASLGRGAPDLMVGHNGRNYLVEIKNPDAGGKLSAGQLAWHAAWRGSVVVVATIDEALAAIGLMQGRNYF